MMPGESEWPTPYDKRSHAELVKLVVQRDSEIDTWRQRWLECQRELANGHSGNPETGR